MQRTFIDYKEREHGHMEKARNFRNYWLQKSKQRKYEKNWMNKLEDVAKAVTQYIRRGN